MNDEPESVKKPTTPEELLAAHEILRSDPQRYLRIVNEWIKADPTNLHAYFDSHFVWIRVGQPTRALEDLNKVIALESAPDPITLMSRGEVYRHLGEYKKAVEDFDRAEAIDPTAWEEDIVFGLLYQADTHARLATSRPRWPVARDCRRIFGLLGLRLLPVAAKRRLPTRCAASQPMPGASEHEFVEAGACSADHRRCRYATPRVSFARPQL